MKIAVIWSRFGPYHVARLRGAVGIAATHGASIYGIEIARRDAQYEWDAVDRSDSFEHITLFDRETHQDIHTRDIQAKLIPTLEAIAPDAIAVNGWAVAEAQAAINWCNGGRRAAAIVMSETKADDSPRVWWKELVKRQILKKCSAALVGGAVQADYLVGLGMSRDRIEFGYDVVDNDYFAQGAAAARADAIRLRARLGLPERYFFACVRFIKRKNIDGLLRAYAVYRSQSPDAPWGLVIAGSGEEKASYDALVRDLSIDGVAWPGFIQYGALPIYYGLAGAFIHPACAEAWGLVVNEALASGLPVIVSRTVGARYELVSEGHNGFSFDPSATDQLADRLLEIAQLDRDRLTAMHAAAFATAAKWSPERFGRGLMAMALLPPKRHGRRRGTLARIASPHVGSDRIGRSA